MNCRTLDNGNSKVSKYALNMQLHKPRKSEQTCLFPWLNKISNKLLKAENQNLREYEKGAKVLPEKLAQMLSEFGPIEKMEQVL